MTVRHISTGSPFEAQIGYSRAVVADGWAFVAGTTGYDYETMVMPDSIADQFSSVCNSHQYADIAPAANPLYNKMPDIKVHRQGVL